LFFGFYEQQMIFVFDFLGLNALLCHNKPPFILICHQIFGVCWEGFIFNYKALLIFHSTTFYLIVLDSATSRHCKPCFYVRLRQHGLLGTRLVRVFLSLLFHVYIYVYTENYYYVYYIPMWNLCGFPIFIYIPMWNLCGFPIFIYIPMWNLCYFYLHTYVETLWYLRIRVISFHL
jgi:hypothetical protein